MQNLIPKFRQSSIIPEKPGYLSEKLKILHTFVSYLTMPTKGCSGYFLLSLDLELLMKMKI